MNKHGWTYKKLGEICETSSGGTPSKNHREYYENGSIPWLRSGEVSQTHISETELFITQLGLDNSSAKIFPVDTVVIAMYGATVGQVGILKKAMCTNQAVCGVFPNSYFKPDFLMHFLKNKKSFFLKQAVGGAQSNISQTIIKNLKLPVPSMEEQEAIVAELDEINEAIAALQQQVADLDALAQSTYYTMFGDPVSNEKGWDVKKLEETGSVITGSTPSTRDKRNYESADYCFFKPSDIERDGITYSDSSEFHISEYAYSNSRKLPKGSVLTTCIGIVGKVAILNIDATCNQQINAIVPNEKTDSIFLAHSIFLLRKIIESLANAPVVPIINKGQFSNIIVPVPPLALQQEFAAKVEVIESAKAELNAQIAEMQTLLASRMDYYFD